MSLSITLDVAMPSFPSDERCNPSGDLISSSNLSVGFSNGRTIIAAVLMFVMVVYSW